MAGRSKARSTTGARAAKALRERRLCAGLHGGDQTLIQRLDGRRRIRVGRARKRCGANEGRPEQQSATAHAHSARNRHDGRLLDTLTERHQRGIRDVLGPELRLGDLSCGQAMVDEDVGERHRPDLEVPVEQAALGQVMHDHRSEGRRPRLPRR